VHLYVDGAAFNAPVCMAADAADVADDVLLFLPG
jgi:hypothetical protein